MISVSEQTSKTNTDHWFSVLNRVLFRAIHTVDKKAKRKRKGRGKEGKRKGERRGGKESVGREVKVGGREEGKGDDTVVILISLVEQYIILILVTFPTFF